MKLKGLRSGCEAFWRRDSRDAMYRVATRLVNESWPAAAEVADGLGVILLTWNQGAFRYGDFDFAALEKLITKHQALLTSFRSRHIRSFHLENDRVPIKYLFGDALEALAYADRMTPVGVAKALHIIAPNFFPIWDRKIAKGCSCRFTRHNAPDKYLSFMGHAQKLIRSLEAQFANHALRGTLPAARDLAASMSKLAGRDKTMLKFLDEFFFSKYTKKSATSAAYR